ncbi:MAG: AAA family ATPase [Eubacteriales bacterium]
MENFIENNNQQGYEQFPNQPYFEEAPFPEPPLPEPPPYFGEDKPSKQPLPVKKLTTMTGATLMTTEFEPLSFAVDQILPQGVFILAGSGKIGKSWLSLDMCIAISTGGRLWDYQANQGEVLYLALEDTYARLQLRMAHIGVEHPDLTRLHFSVQSSGIGDGLVEQVNDFLKAFPDTKLVIIDTLERIRNTETDKSMYSCDYRDMTKLREITDSRKVTLLLVHHTRKMHDSDPLNTLSGSTGLVGSVDGVWVLGKDERTGTTAKLTIANRDTEGFCFKLDFEKEHCRWKFLGHVEPSENPDELLCGQIDSFLQAPFSGTATELCDSLKAWDSSVECFPSSLTKKLNSLSGVLKSKFGIAVTTERNKKNRIISLARI